MRLKAFRKLRDFRFASFFFDGRGKILAVNFVNEALCGFCMRARDEAKTKSKPEALPLGCVEKLTWSFTDEKLRETEKFKVNVTVIYRFTAPPNE